MNAFGLRSLVLFVLAASSAAAASVPELLAKKLRSLTGPDAEDCGSLAPHGERAAAIACARRAQAASKPYRLTVELQGGDFSWQGAARGADGRLWVVFYGTDDGAGSNPSLSLVLCREIRFVEAQAEDVLECIPSLGGS